MLCLWYWIYLYVAGPTSVTRPLTLPPRCFILLVLGVFPQNSSSSSYSSLEDLSLANFPFLSLEFIFSILRRSEYCWLSLVCLGNAFFETFFRVSGLRFLLMPVALFLGGLIIGSCLRFPTSGARDESTEVCPRAPICLCFPLPL